MTLEEKIHRHEAFWRGEGPSLILIPGPEPAGSVNYAQQSADPRLMWEYEVNRARAVIDWPTDGIPTARPNLGVVFIPAIAGQNYRLRDGQMPWPGEPLTEEAIRAVCDVDVSRSEMMGRAATFYACHRESGEHNVIAYHPDTQGVFDIAHMLYGKGIFYDVIDDARGHWVHELLDTCLDLYIRVSRHLKQLLDQSSTTMIHGHATAQGVYLPHAGVRVSEDTATLFSPRTIEEVIMPYVERAAMPFGGAFAHFCGRCEFLFEQLCRSSWIRAIDLQHGMHDPRWLLERCAESRTVLYSRIEAQDGETWPDYTRRLAGLVKETGARCVLRPTVYPAHREECAAMRDLWHEFTA
ncbi:MAG: hypothetical protein HY706_04455 [Candidatus Hydrogenedentes bacterium]|nr:hypothetical protein [Candidatus Hydrogenedentota bacterium]